MHGNLVRIWAPLLIAAACGNAPNSVSDSGPIDAPTAADAATQDAHVATQAVPMREALLFYTRNKVEAETDTDALTPYLAYVNQQGQVLEPYLYDTFVFLDLALIRTEHPTIEGWRHYLDSFFEVAPPLEIARPQDAPRIGSQGAQLTGNGQAVSQTNIPVIGGQTYAWEVYTRVSAEVSGTEALLGLVVRDAQGTPITEDGLIGLTWSSFVNQWYQYLPSTPRWGRHNGTFTLPAEAASVDIQIRQFSAPGKQVSLDRWQLVAGTAPLSFGDAISLDYNTLVQDGDFISGASFVGFVPGEGLERALLVRSAKDSVGQGPFPVPGGGDYSLAVSVRADQVSNDHEALVGVRVFDGSGDQIITGVTGLTYSTYTQPPMFFSYLDATSSWSTTQLAFTLPPQSASVEIYLMAWTDADPWFDDVQLVPGSIPLSPSELQAAGYESLLLDGSVETWNSTAWWVRPDLVVPSGSGFLPALSRVASSIGDPRKRNVLLGIPVGEGMDTHSEFGDVNGQWLDLTVETDRRAALTWFIDEALSRWNNAPPTGLNLVGFYWTDENPGQDPTLAAFVHQYVSNLGLLLTASPYRKFLGEENGCFGSSSLPQFASHFDTVWQQPNVWPPSRTNVTEAMWNTVGSCLCGPGGLDEFVTTIGYPPCELDEVDTFIDQLQTSIDAFSSGTQVHANIEWVPGLEATQRMGRVLDYMNTDGTLGHDYARFPDRMWYEDAGFGHRCALDPDPILRAQYEAVHHFIVANRARHGFPTPEAP